MYAIVVSGRHTNYSKLVRCDRAASCREQQATAAHKHLLLDSCAVLLEARWWPRRPGLIQLLPEPAPLLLPNALACLLSAAGVALTAARRIAAARRSCSSSRAFTMEPVGPAAKRSRAAGGGHVLLLFRTTDLRLHDNAALVSAIAEAKGQQGGVVPAFVWSQREDGHQWGIRGASEVYLQQALIALEASLAALGSRLVLRRCDEGDVSSSSFADEVVALAKEAQADAVHYTVEHTPEARERDTAMVEALLSASPPIRTTAHLSQLLYTPDDVVLGGGFNGGHWGTLMPFLRSCEKSGLPARCLAAPTSVGSIPAPCLAGDGAEDSLHSCGIEGLRLAPMPARRDWGLPIRESWPAGEAEALRACEQFVATGMLRYQRDRSRADLFVKPTANESTGTSPPSSPLISTATSRLSVALRFGELSPRFLYWAIRDAGLPKEVTKTFSRRLHWRDLAYYQLSCFPRMRSVSIRAHYDRTRWVEPEAEYTRRLRAWQRGQTGYPLVDAGMRELYRTGWMSQSIRMVCASFLVEYLRVNWVDGALWFGDTLCDADGAINSMMWQNAGRSGIDQWNFVMSPENASQDPTGRYTREYVPELARLPNKVLHKPWLASSDVLAAAGVELGATYPARVVVDLAAERRASVAAVLQMRRAHQDCNDARGYDIITLPTVAATGGSVAQPHKFGTTGSAGGGAVTTRVFTKEEYRISKAGKVLPPPPPRGRRNTGGGSKAATGGKPQACMRAASKPRPAQKRVTDFFSSKGP